MFKLLRRAAVCWLVVAASSLAACYTSSTYANGDFSGSSITPSTLIALADGQTAVALRVVVKRHDGTPLPGLGIVLSADNSILTQPQSLTDADGATIGTIQATQVGVRTIRATLIYGDYKADLARSAQVSFVSQDSSGTLPPTTSGVAGAVTVTAPSPNYTGTAVFTSSDPLATLPAPYTFVANDKGQHDFLGAVTLRTAGQQTVTVTDAATGAVLFIQTFLVLPGPASQLDVSAPSQAPVAGLSYDLSIVARDMYNNIVTPYAGTVHLACSDANADLRLRDATFTAADAGMLSLPAELTLRTAGPQTVTVRDIGAPSLYGSILLQVMAGDVSALHWVGLPAHAAAGAVLQAEVVAQDAYGNVAPTYTGTVHVSSTDANAQLPGDLVMHATDAGVQQAALSFYLQGQQTVTAQDTLFPALSTSGAVRVQAAGATRFTVQAPASVGAGQNLPFTVTAYDAYANVADGYTGGVQFTYSDTQTLLPQPYTFTSSDAGTHTFTGVMFPKAAGLQQLTATDAANAGLTAQATTTVTPAAAVRLLLGLPNGGQAGQPLNAQATALDVYGNVATNYGGTIAFYGSDVRASYPNPYAFQAADAGTHAFAGGVVLNTSGTKIVAVYDAADSSLGNGSTSVLVATGAPAVFHVTGVPALVTPGQAFSLSVSITDNQNNLTFGYLGTVHFTSSDPQAVLPADYTFVAADNGQHAFASVSLRNPPSQSITAVDAGNPNLLGVVNGIQVASPTGVHFKISAIASPLTAGQSVVFAVTAQDGNNITVSSYTGTVHITCSDAHAVLPADYTFTGSDAGVHTFSFTPKTAGTQSLTTADLGDASINGVVAGMTVRGAAATHLVLSGLGPSMTAGQSGTLTVTAEDSFGNEAGGYAGTVHFTSSDPNAALPSDTTFSADVAARNLSVTFKTANTQAITATDTAMGSITGSLGGLTVAADSLSSFVVTGAGTSTAGVSYTCTVRARDAYNNTITSYAGTVNFTSSDPNAQLPPAYTFAPGGAGDAGTRTFTGGVMFKTAAPQTLTATDSDTPSVVGTSVSIVVSPAATSALRIAGYGPTVSAGTVGSVTVNASDAYGNTVGGYAGTVHFTSSDPNAALPSNFTFSAGSHTFTNQVALKIPGAQTVTVTDTANAALTAQLSVTVNVGPTVGFVLSWPVSPAPYGRIAGVTVTAVDAAFNTTPSYTGTVRFTSGDANNLAGSNVTFGSGDAGVKALSLAPTFNALGTQALTATDTGSPGLTGTGTVLVHQVVAVASSAEAFGHCVLLSDGLSKCWGGNNTGALGLGDTTSRGTSLAQMNGSLPYTQLGTGRTALAITVSRDGGCALLDTHQIKCWGNNLSGELGLGDTTARGVSAGQMGDALPTTALGTHRSVLIFSHSDYNCQHRCAILDDHTLKCWGCNNNGQLGLGDTTNRGSLAGQMNDSLPAVALGTNRTALQVWGGDTYTCALLDNHQVKCWGNNSGNLVGALGLGDTNNRGSAPNQMGDSLPFVSLGTGRTVSQLFGSAYSTCALLDNNTVKCWGAGDNGELGCGDSNARGDNTGEMGDTLPTVSLGTGRTATQINGGARFNCAVLDNGAVKCWGQNVYGELGVGDTNARGDNAGEMGDALPAVPLGTGRTAIQVAARGYGTCALLDNHQVKCWGKGGADAGTANTDGGLGLGDTVNRGTATSQMGDALPVVPW